MGCHNVSERGGFIKWLMDRDIGGGLVWVEE